MVVFDRFVRRVAIHIDFLDDNEMTEAEYQRKKRGHKHLTITCSKCGHDHIIELNCGDRTCPVCRKKWYGYHYKALKQYIELWDHPKIMELTLKNIPDEQFNRDYVKRLRRCFSKLLHREYFKKHIIGGFYFVHLTNQGNGWHLHLHICYDGNSIPKSKLEKEWRDITGDSFVVWIRAIKSPRRALNYLLSDLLREPKIRPGDEDKYNTIFYRSRLIQGFGKYSKFKIRRAFFCPVCQNDCWLVPEFELRAFHKELDDSS